MKIEEFMNVVTDFFLGDKGADAAHVRLDRGVLDVAMMIAAIDGEILPAEIAAYNRLLGECRGVSKADVPAASGEMLRKVGFLTSLKQSGISDRECVVSLVREAKAQLPADFPSGSAADLRRALVFWTMMAVSDGDYSPLECAAVHALAECFSCEVDEAFLTKVENLTKDLASPVQKDHARMELEALIG